MHSATIQVILQISGHIIAFVIRGVKANFARELVTFRSCLETLLVVLIAGIDEVIKVPGL